MAILWPIMRLFDVNNTNNFCHTVMYLSSFVFVDLIRPKFAFEIRFLHAERIQVTF